jgi:hypothetical protein
MKISGIVAALGALVTGLGSVSCHPGYACELKLDSTLIGPGATDICIEYSSEAEAMACEAEGGIRLSVCPSTGAIGVCELSDSVGTQTTFIYGDAGEADAAQSRCKMEHGTWTAE